MDGEALWTGILGVDGVDLVCAFAGAERVRVGERSVMFATRVGEKLVIEEDRGGGEGKDAEENSRCAPGCRGRWVERGVRRWAGVGRRPVSFLGSCALAEAGVVGGGHVGIWLEGGGGRLWRTGHGRVV